MSLKVISFEITSAPKITDPDPDPISAAPGDYLVFVIENNDDDTHTVTIPPGKFKKKTTEPEHPISSAAIDSAEIDPGGIGVILLHVKGKDHFKASRTKIKGKKKKGPHALAKKFKYKYTVEATDVPTLDPQIEINN